MSKAVCKSLGEYVDRLEVYEDMKYYCDLFMISGVTDLMMNYSIEIHANPC